MHLPAFLFVLPGVYLMQTINSRHKEKNIMKGHVKALLQKLGYDARPVVLGPVNHETKYVLEAHPKE